MEKIKFLKIHGNGNDFILIEDLVDNYQLSSRDIGFLCQRHTGIGADGLLMIKPAPEGLDFRMVYYNRDGSRADFCGNGGRCITYAASKILNRKKLFFIADDGPHSGSILENNQVIITLKESRILSSPDLSDFIRQTGIPFEDYFYCNTGVPHLVIRLKNVGKEEFLKYPVDKWGKILRYHEYFGIEGVNISFTIQSDQEYYLQRTYERGVENETLSCGTGSVAVGLYWNQIHNESLLNIKTIGGVNQVKLVPSGKPELMGKVTPVFKGEVEIDLSDE